MRKTRMTVVVALALGVACSQGVTQAHEHEMVVSPAGMQACADYGIGKPDRDWRATTCGMAALAEIAQWRAENPQWDFPAERVRAALERTLPATPTCSELNLAVSVMVAAGGQEDDIPFRPAPTGGCRE